MLTVKRLFNLVSRAAKGEDNFKEGAVGFNGYGFVFRDFDYKSKNSFVDDTGSSKLCSFGAYKNLYKRFQAEPGKVKFSNKLLNYDSRLDLFFGGALSHLIPKLKFGGNEFFFDVWVFVLTPKKQVFPVTFYYRQSGPSIGGWSPDYYLFNRKKKFTLDSEPIVLFSPFNFSEAELEDFLRAFECSLRKVPISDYEGVFYHGFGATLMGIRAGEPFLEDYGSREKKKIETWSYSILGNDLAMDYFYDYTRLLVDFLTLEERKQYPGKTPDHLKSVLIERCYDLLIDKAHKKMSRLAFLVLGDFIMSHGAKMTRHLRQIILKYSDWRYEKNQLKKREDRIERKKFLTEFREKIKNYDGTETLNLSLYTITRVINEKKTRGDNSPIWRQNIDYSINK